MRLGGDELFWKRQTYMSADSKTRFVLIGGFLGAGKTTLIGELARRVPALYFKAGTDSVEHGSEWGREIEDRWRDERYHQPGDEIYDEWDFGGMVDDARLAFWVGLHVANADELPGWKPGDEFEEIRQRMLDQRPD